MEDFLIAMGGDPAKTDVFLDACLREAKQASTSRQPSDMFLVTPLVLSHKLFWS
jgi:hypothetical protein